MANVRIPYRISAKFGYDLVQYVEGSHEYRYKCPECINRKGSPDKSGHLYVSESTYLFHCHRCGYSGKIAYVKKEDRVTYEEDQEKDNELLLKELDSTLNPEKSKFKLKIPIHKVTTSENATKYMLDRGFTYEQMEYYDMRVGNINLEFGRIIIPNQVDHKVYTDMYSARSFIGQNPKYHNPSGVKKSELVFNLHRIKEDSPIILVEGALTAVAAGYHAVASLGKVLSISQASQIAMKHPSVIYVNYDFGAETELINACRLLHKMSPYSKIMQVFMKDDRDAADLSHDEYTACLKQAVEYNPLLDQIEGVSLNGI